MNALDYWENRGDPQAVGVNGGHTLQEATIVTLAHWNLRFVAFEDGIAYYEWDEPAEDSSAAVRHQPRAASAQGSLGHRTPLVGAENAGQVRTP